MFQSAAKVFQEPGLRAFAIGTITGAAAVLGVSAANAAVIYKTTDSIPGDPFAGNMTIGVIPGLAGKGVNNADPLSLQTSLFQPLTNTTAETCFSFRMDPVNNLSFLGNCSEGHANGADPSVPLFMGYSNDPFAPAIAHTYTLAEVGAAGSCVSLRTTANFYSQPGAADFTYIRNGVQASLGTLTYADNVGTFENTICGVQAGDTTIMAFSPHLNANGTFSSANMGFTIYSEALTVPQVAMPSPGSLGLLAAGLLGLAALRRHRHG